MAKATPVTATEETVVANPLDNAPVQDATPAAETAPAVTLEDAMRLIAEQRALIEKLAAANAGRPPVHQSFVHGVPSVLKQKITLADGTVREDY